MKILHWDMGYVMKKIIVKEKIVKIQSNFK